MRPAPFGARVPMTGYLVSLLWAVPIFIVAIVGWRHLWGRERDWTSLGWIATGFAVLLLIGAWTWRVPLDAQGAVARTAEPDNPVVSSVDCEEINERIAAAASASNGALTVSGSALLLDPALWEDLTSGQRDLFATLAREHARCRSTDGVGTALIRSKNGSEVLYEERGG